MGEYISCPHFMLADPAVQCESGLCQWPSTISQNMVLSRGKQVGSRRRYLRTFSVTTAKNC